jgi:hypothetical protein
MGLVVFHTLCCAGNALDALREEVPPGSDTWTALTELLQLLDLMIDRLVESEPLEEHD